MGGGNNMDILQSDWDPEKIKKIEEEKIKRQSEKDQDKIKKIEEEKKRKRSLYENKNT